MEYIRKQTPPPVDWDLWFEKATGGRSYNYALDCSSLTHLANAKNHLWMEQNRKCAYCHQFLTIESSSIEHVIPKEFNIELSTNYYNLVVVCKTPVKDPVTGRSHCDKEKQSKIISPLIFLSNSVVTAIQNSAYFEAYSDGSIMAKQRINPEHSKQAEAFIETLNLNHSLLKQARAKNVLDGLISAYAHLQPHQKSQYWHIMFGRILLDHNKPYRHFLLIFLASRIGIN